MYDQAVDGNLAALRAYELLQARQESALEEVLEHSDMREKLDIIANIATELHEKFDLHEDYNFEDEITEAIKEVI